MPDVAFCEYFRCPEEFGLFETATGLTAQEDYFTFEGLTCFGRAYADSAGTGAGDQPGCARLQFDLAEVVTNLRLERYRQDFNHYVDRVTGTNFVRDTYYLLRPFLPVAARKHLQRVRLSRWNEIPFPRWPVDLTVDTLLQKAMVLQLRSTPAGRIPFIWFWPDGAPSCAILTHDVEDTAGRDFCGTLMDLDDAHGIKASFQVVPEDRYEQSLALCEYIRSRGFEVNVHDLNHDGRLLQSREIFLDRARKINEYARQFQSNGFRSAAMYRRQDWFDALECSYDMSVPTVAHLEPQRGGCCTVMPYFVGSILELPLTTIQDYSLFHILGDYTTALWRTQIDLIKEANGLICLLTHPDYLIEQRARDVYSELLAHVSRLRDEKQLWVALPGEVDRWWRGRSQMTLVPSGSSWSIHGTDSHRARIAYATIENGHLVYEMDAQVVKRTPLYSA